MGFGLEAEKLMNFWKANDPIRIHIIWGWLTSQLGQLKLVGQEAKVFSHCSE